VNAQDMQSITKRLVDAYTADGDPLWENSSRMLHAINEVKGPLIAKQQDMQGVLEIDDLLDQATRVADGLLRRRGY